MNSTEVLELVDDLIFAKTGKHLEDLQKDVLKGTIEGKTYSDIAEDSGFSESHVKNVGQELWNLLSLILGEKISKTNFKGICEKIKRQNFSSAIILGNCHTNPTANTNNINIFPVNIFPDRERYCSATLTRSPTYLENSQESKNQPQLYLAEAPKIFNFYDRSSELTTLENWILKDSSRLIALLGISGIGKTTLTLQLIKQIKTNFNYIIYRSLRFSPTLDETLTKLLKKFPQEADISQNIETKISQLLNYLNQYRCLIILDDLQMLFCSGKIAGQYQTESENYQIFFQLIAEMNHQSCLILNSREKPIEIAQLETKNNSVRSLILSNLGLGAKQILDNHKLSDEETWENLIDIYQGNPRWIEFTATMIQELFDSSVAKFLQWEKVILSESLVAELDKIFPRITQNEQTIIIQLAQENQPVTLHQIDKTVELSTSDLLNSIQSLKRRLLLDIKQEDKTTYFSLNPVLKQYVIWKEEER
ncbi:MAG: AAA family ATPase [Okeania sp. SIO2C9]|uniref:ATP-binding protein n=1 Tax=Okeania sp. SIO2C9 TaxID=2607791 RepID=UPI0013BF640E|nr:ATP-binding protein [Okeania sp. SIO2C9]NEQ72262.1 AAA family ATPase [Okeania sp. SIO2C9]